MENKETKKGEKTMQVEIKERYINPYTDFGFKKLFGTELNKDLLISFLNALLNGEQEITDLTYLNGEHLGDGYGDRRAVEPVRRTRQAHQQETLRPDHPLKKQHLPHWIIC